MTEIPLYDDSESAPVPRAKADMRFAAVAVKPYGDGRRVKLNFKLTPFIERPSVDIAVTNADGHEVASLSLIEAMDTEFDFTIHLRGPEPQGAHTVHLTLFYPESQDQPTHGRQIVAEQAVAFVVTPSG